MVLVVSCLVAPLSCITRTVIEWWGCAVIVMKLWLVWCWEDNREDVFLLSLSWCAQSSVSQRSRINKLKHWITTDISTTPWNLIKGTRWCEKAHNPSTTVSITQLIQTRMASFSLVSITGFCLLSFLWPTVSFDYSDWCRFGCQTFQNKQYSWSFLWELPFAWLFQWVIIVLSMQNHQTWNNFLML